jgi:hypothetical protein
MNRLLLVKNRLGCGVSSPESILHRMSGPESHHGGADEIVVFVVLLIITNIT